jgi:hypothetical protein
MTESHHDLFTGRFTQSFSDILLLDNTSAANSRISSIFAIMGTITQAIFHFDAYRTIRRIS